MVGKPTALMTAAAAVGVPIATVGKFTGDTVKFGAAEAPLSELAALYRGSFEAAVG